jgi:peroxiredoxin Q/BCP
MHTHLQDGQEAPLFDLPDGDGPRHRLSDYRGRKVLLYFYPRDDTPGCTLEAVSFARSLDQYVAQGIAVLGVSTDTPQSHVKFAKKFSLPFPLLSDADGSVTRAYGAAAHPDLAETRARRVTFLIDEDGRIEKIWDPVSAPTHNEEVLHYFSRLA